MSEELLTTLHARLEILHRTLGQLQGNLSRIEQQKETTFAQLNSTHGAIQEIQGTINLIKSKMPAPVPNGHDTQADALAPAEAMPVDGAAEGPLVVN